MSEDRRDQLASNRDRSIDTEGSNPANLQSLAAELLNDVAYASTLINPNTARALATLKSDIELSVEDERAGEIMFASSAVSTVTVRTSIIAPLVKLVAGRRDERVKSDHERRSQLAGRKRLQYISSLKASDRPYMTWRTTEQEWPINDKGGPVAPLDIHIGSREAILALNPYQIQACGIVELVRACGRVLGNCDGDWLADRFMRMILKLGAGSTEGADLVAGGFVELAESEEVCEWEPLSGRKQMKAVTILAAWLRMARLGVPLHTRKNLESWQNFFDGTLYGADPDLSGQVWELREPKRGVFEKSEYWLGTPEPPWLTDSSGSPVIVYGIAGELLRKAIAKVQAVGFVPDNFDPHEVNGERNYDISDKVLVQLRRHHREVAGCALGSVVSAIIIDE